MRLLFSWQSHHCRQDRLRHVRERNSPNQDSTQIWTQKLIPCHYKKGLRPRHRFEDLEYRYCNQKSKGPKIATGKLIFYYTVCDSRCKVKFDYEKLFANAQKTLTLLNMQGLKISFINTNTRLVNAVCFNKKPNTFMLGFARDLVRIQTWNLQSRNLMLYSVELRSHFRIQR